jgi:ferric-dicitrate binding protein FerR (iron transport regulator)
VGESSQVGSQTTSAQPSASMCDTPQRLLQSPTLPSLSSATPTPRPSKRRRESRGATASIIGIATGCAGCRWICVRWAVLDGSILVVVC